VSPRPGWKKRSLPCEFKPELFSLPGEEWRPAVGWERMYRASNMGRVYTLHEKGRIATGMLVRGNYRVLKACDRERRANLMVHRMVLTAFRGPCPEGMEGCHNNGNSQDNRLSNLRWDTRLSNCADKRIHKAIRTLHKIVPNSEVEQWTF